MNGHHLVHEVDCCLFFFVGVVVTVTVISGEQTRFVWTEGGKLISMTLCPNF